MLNNNFNSHFILNKNKNIFSNKYYLLTSIFTFALFPYCLSLNCFECFDQSQLCTRFTNCSGSACILYENLTNRSSVAFCLLIAAERQGSNLMVEEGCWHDTVTNGIQCLCQKDFCNSPRNLWTSDPNKPPIEGLKMLKRNPFVDYEYLEEESSIGKKTSSSSSESVNSILSSLDDSNSDNGDERDLIPINFDDYMNWVENNSDKNIIQITDNDTLIIEATTINIQLNSSPTIKIKGINFLFSIIFCFLIFIFIRFEYL